MFKKKNYILESTNTWNSEIQALKGKVFRPVEKIQKGDSARFLGMGGEFFSTSRVESVEKKLGSLIIETRNSQYIFKVI